MHYWKSPLYGENDNDDDDDNDNESAHLAGRARDLVDDIGEHHVLVVGLRGELLPLSILADPHVVPEEGMRHAGGGKSEAGLPWKVIEGKNLCFDTGHSDSYG